MRNYEIVYILSPEVPEENLPAAMEKVHKFITSRGGEITKVDQWGRRKLAYPIKNFREGNYVLTEFKADPKAANDMEANLRISEEVLRHLVVNKDA